MNSATPSRIAKVRKTSEQQHRGAGDGDQTAKDKTDQLQTKGTNRELIPIYTEWANHHLLRAKLPPLRDLASELCLPHKLILLVHSITFEFQKVPKDTLVGLLSAEDPLHSVRKCTAYLRQIGVRLGNIHAHDIHNAHLGAVLQLVYQLSVYKQQQREQIAAQLHRQRHAQLEQCRPALEGPSPKRLAPSSVSHSSGYSSCRTAATSSCTSSQLHFPPRRRRPSRGPISPPPAEQMPPNSSPGRPKQEQSLAPAVGTARVARTSSDQPGGQLAQHLAASPSALKPYIVPCRGGQPPAGSRLLAPTPTPTRSSRIQKADHPSADLQVPLALTRPGAEQQKAPVPPKPASLLQPPSERRQLQPPTTTARGVSAEPTSSVRPSPPSSSSSATPICPSAADPIIHCGGSAAPKSSALKAPSAARSKSALRVPSAAQSTFRGESEEAQQEHQTEPGQKAERLLSQQSYRPQSVRAQQFPPSSTTPPVPLSAQPSSLSLPSIAPPELRPRPPVAAKPPPPEQTSSTPTEPTAGQMPRITARLFGSAKQKKEAPDEEKKPTLAVKGIAVATTSCCTPSTPSSSVPAQLALKSPSAGGQPQSQSSAETAEGPQSPLAESRRHSANPVVVGVVSPMQQHKERDRGGRRGEEAKDSPGQPRTEAAGPGRTPETVGSTICSAADPSEAETGQSAADTRLSEVPPSPPPARPSVAPPPVPAKKSLPKPSKLLKMPTRRAEEEADKGRGECPSPTVPPPLAPTKLMSVLREAQASPCSSCLSSPEQDQREQLAREQLLPESTTSNDSLDTVRTAIARLPSDSESAAPATLPDCAIELRNGNRGTETQGGHRKGLSAQQQRPTAPKPERNSTATVAAESDLEQRLRRSEGKMRDQMAMALELRELRRRHHNCNRESYEDSSSLSSGLSDDDLSTDDLTASSSDCHLGPLSSPEKMRHFVADYGPQRAQPPPLHSAAEREQRSADKLLQKCQSAQRGCAYFDPHRPSTSNGYHLPEPFVRNSEARRSGQLQQQHHFPHPNEQQRQLSLVQQQQNQQFLFRPYHTITAGDWPPQQQQRRQQHFEQRRRLLSPPHNLMVLSDDGDTLSVAAGEVGGARVPQQQQQQQQMAQMPPNFQTESLPRRQHPAYHTHSLDRHAHLRVFSAAGSRPPPPSAPTDPCISTPPPQQQYASIGASRHQMPPHQRLQLSSLLVSPRHFNGSYTSTFAPGPNGNSLATAAVPHRRSRGYYDHQQQTPVAPPAARSCVDSPHQRSASLSAMSRSMCTVMAAFEEQQQEKQRTSERSGENQRRVLEYVRRQLAALNRQNNNGNEEESRPSPPPPMLPIPPRRTTTNSPHYVRRAPFSLPRQESRAGNGSLSARDSSSRIYSNLSLKFPHSGVNSPTRMAALTGIPQPGSQMSLASSIGSTYSTIEERYEWEISKLQSELESYRTHVSLLNQKNSGYNCMLQLFDNRLQAIMLSIGKLQQKHNVKRDEVELLCNEIEQLRALSITAGVVPPRTAEAENGRGMTKKGVKGKVDSGEGEQSKKSWIRSSFSRAFHKSSKKSKQQQSSGPSSVCSQELAPTANGNNSSSGSSSMLTSRQQNGEAQPAEVVLLKRELEDKEMALTDVQLDALDKAKEIDILRDTINRLQHENKLLKYNFTVLERRVRSESRASSHLSLNTTCLAAQGLDFDVALEEALVEAPEQLASHYDLVASSPSSGDISVNTTTGSSTGSALPHHIGKSMNRGSFASSTASSSKRSSQGALLCAKVVLCVDLSGRLDSPSSALLLPPSSSLASISKTNSGSSSTLSSQASSGFGSVASGGAAPKTQRRELTIGHLPLPIAAGTSWRELDQQLGLLLEDYLHRIDPDLSLGVDSYSSIIGYQIHATQNAAENSAHPEIFLVRRRGSISECGGNGEDHEELTPKLAPSEALQPGTLIRMRLKGVAQNSVDALVLESLFPRHLLDQLLRQLEQHRRLLLFGPTGIGKSNLARLLAKYLLMRTGDSVAGRPNSFVDIRFPSEDGPESEAKVHQVKEQLAAALRPGTGAAVLVMDNVQWKRLGTVLDAFNNSFPTSPSNVFAASPYVLCTLNRTCVDQSPVQQLQLHHNFRLYALSYKMDAVNGYLGRYLRRRLAEQELSSYSLALPLPSPPIESIVHFLGCALRAVNEFIERAATGGPDVTLGPRILLQCPLGESQARDWFTQLWNDKLVPYMGKVLAESKPFSSDGARHSALAKDPIEEIRTVWPWTEGREQLKALCQ